MGFNNFGRASCALRPLEVAQNSLNPEHEFRGVLAVPAFRMAVWQYFE